MLCLGLSGGFNLVHENAYRFGYGISHDGAAALVEDGRLVGAIEEERLNRIKHSNKFPARAVRFCLDRRGVSADDIDRFAFYMQEDCCNRLLSATASAVSGQGAGRQDARSVLRDRLQHTLQREIAPERIAFVPHHLAHATSAFALSGFHRSLILAVDGVGDFLSGIVAVADAARIEEIRRLGMEQSLGGLYFSITHLLGYTYFDEYKVMGLAPYGDPARYRPVLRSLYDLLPDGDYALRLDAIAAVLGQEMAPRRRGAPIEQRHKDLAAALQESLEDIVLHLLTHYRAATGCERLCLAGGVAQNCTMNGRILYSGLFDRVFVQPASHDAGCALGAALAAAPPVAPHVTRAPLQHVFWGSDVADDEAAARELDRWSGFVSYERVPDITRAAADLLADGAVIAWMQGRSEFGPRALGHRSILADPRPAENRARINDIIKKREAFRPFAPAVLEEDVLDYFDVPIDRGSFAFMSFVVRVRQDKRALLGAVTHVDGSARLQTVSRETNPRFWRLLQQFKARTGIPCLLNTSFNNNAEPIVESVADGIVTCLTTELDYLVVNDYLVTKRRIDWTSLAGLRISLPSHVQLLERRGFTSTGEGTIACALRSTHDEHFQRPVSRELHRLLAAAHDAPASAPASMDRSPSGGSPTLVQDLMQLWQQRLVVLQPSPIGTSVPPRAVTV